MSVALSLLLALLLDYLFREPKRFHPLVGFGNLANWLEQRLNRPLNQPLNRPLNQPLNRPLNQTRNADTKRAGMLAWAAAVLPLTLLALLLEWSLGNYPVLQALVAAGVLYLGIGWQSLLSHAKAVAEPLQAGDLVQARQAVAMIVSRDTSTLDEQAVASAATESVLENGADAIFAAIFWFCLLGIPGVVLYRLSNTLDAMWGYKNERFLAFGWCAARIDDLLNFIPARLTALSYALAGHTRIALHSWWQQAADWKSPNAGPVMSAGAGAINVALGGAAIYHGQLQQRPPLGPQTGQKPGAASIIDACELVNRVLLGWVVVLYLSLALVVAVTSAGGVA